MAKQKTTGSFDNLWDVDTSSFQNSSPRGKGEESVRTGNSDIDNVEDLDEEQNEYEDEDYAREMRNRSVDSDDEDEEDEDTGANNGSRKQAEEEEDSYDDDESDEEDALLSDSDFIQNTLQELIDDETLSFDPDKEYPTSLEGLRELINETKEVFADEAVENFKSSMGEEGAELMDYLSKGFSVDEYLEMKQEVDFSKVDLNSERNQALLVEDWLKVQGHSQDEIQDLIETYMDSNILDKQAKIAQSKLSAWQKQNNEARIKQREEEIENRQIEEQQLAEEFREDVLNAEEIAGFKVSKSTRQRLLDYITKPVNREGKTQFQLDDNVETRMLYALLAMNKFDRSTLEQEIRTKQSIKLKRDLSNYSDSASTNRNSGDPVKRAGQVSPKINWQFGPGRD